VTPTAAAPVLDRRSPRCHLAILDATVELLAEVGVARLTIEGVAARAGVGKTTVYRHWPSKAELVIEAFGSLIATVKPAPTGDLRTDLVERVRAVVGAVSRPPLAAILPSLVDAAERDPELGELCRQFTAHRRRSLLDLLEAGAEQGSVTGDVELLADLLAGPVFYRRLIARSPVDDDYAERLVDTLLPLFTPPPAHT
jgi:AcrR family transcriptional regulator